MKRGFNIGTFLFAAVFIYLLIALILYLARDHVVPYEVCEGSIVEDSVYTGVIVRQEKSVKSRRAGYLSFYLDDKSKSGKEQPVCVVSGENLQNDLLEKSKKRKKLSEVQQSSVIGSIQDYLSSADRNHYDKLYDLHDEIESASGIASSEYTAKQIDRLAEGGLDIEYVNAPNDGLIVYTTDSLDGLKGSDIKEKIFDQKNYSKRSIRTNKRVKKGETLFKIITSENWQVFFPINRQMKKKLSKVKMIETRLGNRPGTIWGDFDIVKSGSHTFGKLTYVSNMLRFSSQRFIAVELILQNDEGFKIPKSSVTEHAAYEIPEDYVITDPDTGKSGVQMIRDKGKRQFISFDIFYREDGLIYVKTDAFHKGDMIGKDNDDDMYTVGKKRRFKGVFNINKGYAVFQPIDVIASNDKYYVIDKNSAFGPELYDHIALNAAKLSENKVVQVSQ